MSYCPDCGAYIPEGDTVCPACGHDSAASAAQSAGGASAAAQQAEAQARYTDTSRDPWEGQPKGKDPWDDRPKGKEPWETGAENWKPWKASDGGQRTAGAGTGAAGADEQERRKLSVLSYVGPLFLVPLFLRKGDPFARFHANQGLVLFLLECLVLSLGDRFGFLALVGVVFCVYCIVKGARSVAEGRMDRLPLIGGLTLIK